MSAGRTIWRDYGRQILLAALSLSLLANVGLVLILFDTAVSLDHARQENAVMQPLRERCAR